MRTACMLIPLAAVSLIACESGSPASSSPEPAPSAQDDGVGRYGDPIRMTKTVPLRTVLEKPGQFENQTVLVEGKVRRNCTVKGCWMELAPGMDKSLPGCRVTFKDYGFFVPLDSAGAAARVEGAVETKQVPADEVEHMEGEGATFPNKADDGSATEVRLVATGVELRHD